MDQAVGTYQRVDEIGLSEYRLGDATPLIFFQPDGHKVFPSRGGSDVLSQTGGNGGWFGRVGAAGQAVKGGAHHQVEDHGMLKLHNCYFRYLLPMMVEIQYYEMGEDAAPQSG
jgi:hypothetical protein